MVDIEDLRGILIDEKIKKWEAENPPKEDWWDEHNKRVLKHNSPDMVKKPYLPIKPLNNTIWKKMYVTPNLEMKKLAILEQCYKNALIQLLLIMLYPFAVIFIIFLIIA
jgi:hypothetical protein